MRERQGRDGIKYYREGDKRDPPEVFAGAESLRGDHERRHEYDHLHADSEARGRALKQAQDQRGDGKSFHQFRKHWNPRFFSDTDSLSPDKRKWTDDLTRLR